MTQRENIRLVVCCDGTWQQRSNVDSILCGKTQTCSEGSWYSNVALLSRAIASGPFQSDLSLKRMLRHEDHEEKLALRRSIESDMKRDNKRQVVFYQSGVGTEMSRLANLAQGASGLGLLNKVEEAYSFLADNYVEGDEIFLFGFSRGAYTARAIGGFINWGGILPKSLSANFSQIFSAYQQRKPDDAESIKKASDVFYKYTGLLPSLDASKTAGIGGRDSKGLGSGVDNVVGRVEPPPIKFVGVWDTVGALGIPGHFMDPKVQDFFSFFDPGLAPNVDVAIQSLSLDEDRQDFLPTIWYQPEGREKQRIRIGKPPQILRQVWHIGSHSDCGGGFAEHNLSDISLAFMISNLLDGPDGPLLRIDLDIIKDTQDRRKEWSKQDPHPSRGFMSFSMKARRQVGANNINPRLVNTQVWESQVQHGSTNEEIHHSVFTSGRYNHDSTQFQTLRSTVVGRSHFDQMWKKAQSEDSLGRTEKYLRWDTSEPGQDCPSGSDDIETIGQELKSSLLSLVAGIFATVSFLLMIFVKGPFMYAASNVPFLAPRDEPAGSYGQKFEKKVLHQAKSI